jgi:hypothetical protein
MLERHKGEIAEAIVRFEVVEEAAEPGIAALGVPPGLDVFGDALKGWTAELKLGIDAM